MVLRLFLQTLAVMALLLTSVPVAALAGTEPVAADGHCREAATSPERDSKERQDESKAACCKVVGSCCPATASLAKPQVPGASATPDVVHRILSDTLQPSAALQPPTQPPTRA